MANSKLKCKIKPNIGDIKNVNGTAHNASDPNKIIDITNDFPIQKWVFITVVVDAANIVDYYLDGKLVKSVKLEDVLIAGNNSIEYGKSHDTWIAQFKRTPKTLGPQDVWNMYAKGNPGSNLSSALGNYNVNLSILKDNAVSSSLSLF